MITRLYFLRLLVQLLAVVDAHQRNFQNVLNVVMAMYFGSTLAICQLAHSLVINTLMLIIQHRTFVMIVIILARIVLDHKMINVQAAAKMVNVGPF